MGSQVPARRMMPRRRAAEESHSREKVLEFDLNIVPEEVLEMPGSFQWSSGSSARLQNIIHVEDSGGPAMSPICVDEIEDDVVVLSDSFQVSRTGRDVNWVGRASMRNRARDIIHIDSESRSLSPVEDHVLTVDYSYGIISGSQIFNLDPYEDLEGDRHSKRIKAGSNREMELDMYEDHKEKGMPAFKCAVCLGSMVEETSTNCGHLFCQDCIKTAIKVQKKCPTCRKKLSMKNIHRIYFPGST